MWRGKYLLHNHCSFLRMKPFPKCDNLLLFVICSPASKSFSLIHLILHTIQKQSIKYKYFNYKKNVFNYIFDCIHFCTYYHYCYLFTNVNEEYMNVIMDESINFVVAQYVTVLNCPQLTFKALYILTDNKDPVVMILSVNVVTIK